MINQFLNSLEFFFAQSLLLLYPVFGALPASWLFASQVKYSMQSNTPNTEVGARLSRLESSSSF